MKLMDTFESRARCAGATTWMLNHLIGAIVSGEPQSIVIAANQAHHKTLSRQFEHLLIKYNIKFKNPRVDWYIVYDTEVNFITARAIKDQPEKKPSPSMGLYIDHFVIDSGCLSEEEIERLL